MSTTTQNLGINISSSVSGALPGINAVTDSLKRVQLASYSAATGLSRLAPAAQTSVTAFAALRTELANGGRNLSQFSVNINGVATSLRNTSRPAGNAGVAIQNLGRVASDLPFGFIAIQNNLDPLIDSFSRLAAANGGVKGAFKALGATLAGPAGVALAFTVVSAGVTYLIQKYGSLGNAYQALLSSVDASVVLQRKYNDAIAESVGAVSGEVAKIQGLISVAQDETVSREQRLRAIKLVQKEYPDYLKNLNLENINSKETAASIDKITEALIRQAKIKGAQDLISKEATKIVQAQTKPLEDQASILAKIATLALSFGTAPSQNEQFRSSILLPSGFKERSKDIKEATANITSLQKVIDDLLHTDAEEGTLGLDKDLTKTGPKIKTISSIVKELEKDIDGINLAFAATGGTINDLVSDKVQKFSTALKALSELGVKPGDKIFDQLKAQLDQITQATNKTKVTLKIKPTIDLTSAIDAKNTAAIDAVTRGIKMKFRDGLVDVGKIVSDSLKGGAAEAISTISDGIGAAIGGGGLKAALGGFINAISSFGSSLGKQLIAQGVALIAFNASLKSLNGPTAIIAGAALIAASAAFKGLAGKGVSAFATGGTVFGPQLAMIGDNPGREEHIIPSEVLDKMGGTAQELSVQFSVSEFIIWLNRGQRTNG